MHSIIFEIFCSFIAAIIIISIIVVRMPPLMAIFTITTFCIGSGAILFYYGEEYVAKNKQARCIEMKRELQELSKIRQEKEALLKRLGPDHVDCRKTWLYEQ